MTNTVRPWAKHLRSLADTAYPIGLIVAVYMVIDRAIGGLTDLGGAGYRRPVLLVELFEQQVFVIGGACIGAAALGLWARSVGPVWPSFDGGWSLRVPVGVIVVVLTWTYACYDYNLWADQLHAFDRLALVALAGLVFWRPIFLAPWTVVVSMLAFQFRHPVGIDQLAEVFQLVRVVELFVAVVLIRLVTSRWYQTEFVSVTIALIASAYWVSGLGKVRLGWIGVGPHLDSLFLATHANGWLGFLSPEAASDFGRMIGRVGWPLLLGGAVVELGALAVLWGRRPLMLWLGAAVTFHLGVFAITGIFFWKWIVFELTLLAFFRRDQMIRRLPIFGWSQALIATVLILAGPVWSKPVDLSWLDSPVNYVYRFEATTTDGTSHQLAPVFFRPHDYLFTLSAFDYLAPDPVLPVVWGATHDQQLFEELAAAENPAAVFEIESAFGSVAFDPERTAALDAFLVDYIGTWNQRGSRSSGFSAISPPPQLWTSDDANSDITGTIDAVTVWQVTTFWNGEQYAEIRTRIVHEVTIIPSR